MARPTLRWGSTSSAPLLVIVVNLSAAILLLVSLSQAFNHGAALIQLLFCGMSVVGIVSRLHPLRRLRLQHRQRSAAPAPQPIRWTRPGLAAKRS